MEKNSNNKPVKEIKQFVVDDERDPKEIRECKKKHNYFKYHRSKR
jgi:hypothetical protein